MNAVIDRLTSWIKTNVEKAGAKGAVFGLSGGIDSGVLAGLMTKALPKNHLGVIMPCHSDPKHVADARTIADCLGARVITVDLSRPWDEMLTAAQQGWDLDESAVDPPQGVDLAAANIKPRLRMSMLYYLAARLGYLVVGAENLVEISIGYFTKYGDGGADLFPLGELSKGEVKQIGEALGLPAEIVHQNPTAGLWIGQTDEEEIGMTYDQLDRYLLTGEAASDIKAKIDALIERSEHKRHFPPSPKRSWLFGSQTSHDDR